MEIINEGILEYLENHCPEEPELLRKLDRETNLTIPYPNMLTGHMQGRFLSFISKMIRPKNILEIGTYTGYSSICFSEGLAEGGRIHTIDLNEEVEDIAMRYFREAGLDGTVIRHQGDALSIIPQFGEKFDIIFLDADKENYPAYLPLCKDKLNPEGLLMVDNTLWSGKVLQEAHSGDFETKGIARFNEMVKNDPDLDYFLLPLRDGITLIRLKS
ncbi:MAG TPA: O-methyltransferase [Bacteroidales bacterium]|nr:O-methyltransferase [Bacteroidales bacterium]